MHYVKWALINGLFMAFFLFSGYLPPFVFNGGYLVIWILTIIVILATALGVFMFIVLEDDPPDWLIELKANVRSKLRSRFYYQLDAAYDVVMVFILGGLGLYVYAVFYAISQILIIWWRNLLKN